MMQIIEQQKGNWLYQYAKNVTSQTGDDGILEKIFSILEVSIGWCVEFGAWDGNLYSNTYNLIQNYDWSGILIEGDKKKFDDLMKTHGSNPRVSCLQKFVSFDPPHDLDSLLSRTDCPFDFDLLSIDIDSFDYHVWESLVKYQPKVVVIEFNATIPNHISFVQPRDTRIRQGNSLLSLINLGKRKGYELIATTSHNGFFVKKEIFPLFNIEDNSIDAMKDRSPAELTVFQLYDGTLVFQGFRYLAWGGEKIKSRKLQVLPKYLRFYSTDSLAKRICRKVWRKIWRL
jgi:hypothetical protein